MYIQVDMLSNIVIVSPGHCFKTSLAVDAHDYCYLLSEDSLTSYMARQKCLDLYNASLAYILDSEIDSAINK